MSRLPVPPMPLPVSPGVPFPLGSLLPLVSDPLELPDLPEPEDEPEVAPLFPDELSDGLPIPAVPLRSIGEPLRPLLSVVPLVLPPAGELPASVEVSGAAALPAPAPPGCVGPEPEPAGPVAPDE